MSFLARFKKKPEPTPMERMKSAIDELNAAAEALPEDLRHLRVYTIRPQDTLNRRPRVLLGFWNQMPCGPEFVTIHGEL